MSSYGLDTGTVSYGQNIFTSYSQREGDFGHDIGQGLRKTVLNEYVTVEYPIFKSINLFAFAQYNWRLEWQKTGISNEQYFSLGIRSRIWNSYADF